MSCARRFFCSSHTITTRLSGSSAHQTFARALSTSTRTSAALTRPCRPRIFSSPRRIMPAPQPPFSSFTTVNFYNGSKLNRLSWLRNDAKFLNNALHSPRTRFVLLQNLNPLTHKEANGEHKAESLATMSWEEIKPFVMEAVKSSGHNGSMQDLFGPAAYGLQPPADAADSSASKTFDKSTAGMGPTALSLVFLGVDESDQTTASLPGQMVQADAESSVPPGTPYFALSLTFKPKGETISPMKPLEDKILASSSYDFVDTRALSKAGDWPASDAALVSQARSLIDWNERHPFCPACSRRQFSLWGGWKRSCRSALGDMGGEQNQSLFAQSLSTLSAEEDSTLGTCPSNATLNSFNYPRTDPVVIMGVISPDGERLLLGRQKKWPQGFWSCLAGFIEPGESLEEAVRREVLEEAGVPLRDVVYHSSQSWPFPSQLMIGAIGIAAPHPKDTGDLSKLPEVRLDLDNELEGAEWYTREELLSVLEKSSKSHFTREDVKRIEDAQNAAGSGTQQKDEGSVANTDPNNIKDGFKIPPATAIAHVLIASWARGEAILPAGVGQKQLRQQQQANI